MFCCVTICYEMLASLTFSECLICAVLMRYYCYVGKSKFKTWTILCQIAASSTDTTQHWPGNYLHYKC